MTLGVLTCFNDTKEKQLSKGTDWKGKIVANALRLQWSPSLKYQGTSCAFMW